VLNLHPQLWISLQHIGGRIREGHNHQHDRVADGCSSGFEHGWVKPEPVASLTIWFERGVKADTIDGPLNHGHAA
jgi:hypothetical protein